MKEEKEQLDHSSGADLVIAPKPVHRRGEGRGCDGIALTHHLQATMELSGNGITLKPPKAPQGVVDGDARKPP